MPRIAWLTDLMTHVEWADATMWRLVLEGSAEPDARLTGWLHHVHLVQGAFLSAWRGEPVRMSEPSDFDGLPAIAAWGRRTLAGVRHHIEALDEDDLDVVVDFPWAEEVAVALERPPAPVRLGESALQVVLHSTHHRGQIATRLRELGAEPPLIDFIGWLWRERPDPDWELPGLD